MTAREALAKSKDGATVRIGMAAGLDKVLQLCHERRNSFRTAALSGDFSRQQRSHSGRACRSPTRFFQTAAGGRPRRIFWIALKKKTGPLSGSAARRTSEK